MLETAPRMKRLQVSFEFFNSTCYSCCDDDRRPNLKKKCSKKDVRIYLLEMLCLTNLMQEIIYERRVIILIYPKKNKINIQIQNYKILQLSQTNDHRINYIYEGGLKSFRPNKDTGHFFRNIFLFFNIVSL